MLSNFVRIRKQNGISWFLIHLLVYSFTIPVFFTFQFIASLSRVRYLGRDMKSVGGFSSNVMKLWTYCFTIVRNRPYFYKVL